MTAPVRLLARPAVDDATLASDPAAHRSLWNLSMRIDFSRLTAGLSYDTTRSPRELFDLLPNKHERYEYLRDVQSEVLDAWSDRRNSRDLTIKMNTGSGKTVVGLLVLKSCLNEGIGPAVYVAPSPYLVSQVLREAQELALEATEDAESLRFASGKAILVVNVYKLINGLSVFGVGEAGPKIRIGTLLVDDAHACLETAEDQFTLTAGTPAHDELLTLFEKDLTQQSEPSFLDLKSGDPHTTMLVPFWAWASKQSEVVRILHSHAKDTAFKFSLPLLKAHLPFCRCAFGSGKVEISPRCLPISAIPSFGAAKRRIFMSATFRDDSILVTHFDADAESLRQVVTPKSGGDIGDRMILVPQEANPEITDVDLRSFFADVATKHNVVVIVPSTFRTQFWKGVASRILDSDTLEDGVKALKAGHVGLVVLNNKYDGIDLPKSACHVLVIDGLPDVRRRIDKIDEGALTGSATTTSQSIQRIEQGMGRGVRSKDDHCAVFLMGRSLTSRLYAHEALNFFTSATRAQLELSGQLASQLRGGTTADFRGALDLFLSRDVEWVKRGRAAVVGAEYGTQALLSETALCERRAFNAAAINDIPTAVSEMQKAVSAEDDSRVKAWLKVELAEYTQRLNPGDAQQILKAAVAANNQLTRPLDGIQYLKMGSLSADQGAGCIAYLQKLYPDPNRLIIDVNGFTDALVFAPETAPLFERTLASVAFLLGLAGQRPEAETGRGPDVLWSLGSSRFLVIECKNGATTDTINKHDCNQLTGSMQWFEDKYGSMCTAVPILVHPARVFEHAATPHPDTRIVTKDKLDQFCQALRGFSAAVAGLPKYGTPEAVAKLLAGHGLAAGELAQRFSVEFKAK
jgi:hypothetical protein